MNKCHVRQLFNPPRGLLKKMTYVESKAEAHAGHARIVFKGGFAYFVGLAILIGACSVIILIALYRSHDGIDDLKKDVANLHREVEIASREHATELQRIRRFVEQEAKTKAKLSQQADTLPSDHGAKKGDDGDIILGKNMAFTSPYVNAASAYDLQYWICQHKSCHVVLKADHHQYDILTCSKSSLCRAIRGIPKENWFRWEDDDVSVWALSSHHNKAPFHKIPLAARKEDDGGRLQLHECDKEKCIHMADL